MSGPHMNKVMLLLLRHAKVVGFTVLVIMLNTFLLGWCPHNLDMAYLPFAAGIGVQVSTSDPVFMGQQMDGSLALHLDKHPAFRKKWT